MLLAGLDWRQAALLRAVARYLQQAGIPFAQKVLSETLGRHPAVATALVDLFVARFDPARTDEATAAAAQTKIESGLEADTRLDEDLIVRRVLHVLVAMVRTPSFLAGSDGAPAAEISFKLDSKRIEGLPEPKPFREIFVHSPEVEGVHLRFGPVARGGIRWSDRDHDFRTEILGLAKGKQQIDKNLR